MTKATLMLLLLVAAIASFAQGRTVFTSSLFRPKPGQAKAFEAALKSHTQRFHGTDKMRVFQFQSGPNDGCYQLVQGPYTWAALDSLKLGDVHDGDFDSNIATKAAEDDEMKGSSYSRLRPELGYGSQDITIEKSSIVTLNVKRGRLDSVLNSIRLLKETMQANNDKRNMTVYTKMLAGTAPQVVLIFRFKNGWADQEEGYYMSFKDMMTKAGAPVSWAEWQRMNDANIESQQSALRTYRKDLSSQ